MTPPNSHTINPSHLLFFLASVPSSGHNTSNGPGASAIAYNDSRSEPTSLSTNDSLDPLSLSHMFLYSDINQFKQGDNYRLRPCLAPVMTASLGNMLSSSSLQQNVNAGNISGNYATYNGSCNNNIIPPNQSFPLSSRRFTLVVPPTSWQNGTLGNPENTHILVLQIEDGFDTTQSTKSRVGIVIDHHSSGNNPCNSITSLVSSNNNIENNSHTIEPSAHTTSTAPVSGIAGLFSHSHHQKTSVSTPSASTSSSSNRVAKLRATDGFTSVILVESEPVEMLSRVKAGCKIILDIRYLFGRCYGSPSCHSGNNNNIDVLQSSCVLGLTAKSVLFVGGYVPSMALQHERQKVQLARAFSGRPQPISSEYDPEVPPAGERVGIQSPSAPSPLERSNGTVSGEGLANNSHSHLYGSPVHGQNAMIGATTSIDHTLQNYDGVAPFVAQSEQQQSSMAPISYNTTPISGGVGQYIDNQGSTSIVNNNSCEYLEAQESTRNVTAIPAEAYNDLSLVSQDYTSTERRSTPNALNVVSPANQENTTAATYLKYCTVVSIIGDIQVVSMRRAGRDDATTNFDLKFSLLAQLREASLGQGANLGATVVVDLGHEFISDVILNGMECETFLSIMLTEPIYGSSLFVPRGAPPAVSLQQLQHDIRDTSQQLMELPAMYFRVKECCPIGGISGEVGLEEEQQLIYPIREGTCGGAATTDGIPLYLVVEVLPEI